MLGFLDIVRRNPDLFAQFFVWKEKTHLDLECFQFEKGQTSNTVSFFKRAIDEFSIEQRHALCMFITGSAQPPLSEKVNVMFDDSAQEFFASTCLSSLTVPTKYVDYAVFKAALLAVIPLDKVVFNTI